MKMKKLLAYLLSLVLVLTSAGFSKNAKAAGEALSLTVARSGDELTLTLAVNESMSLTAGGFLLEFDSDVFTRGTVTSPFSVIPSGNAVVLYGADVITFAAGDALATIKFTVGEGFEKNTEYVFTVKGDEFNDENYELVDWSTDSFSTTYIERTFTVSFDADGGTPAPEAQTVDENGTATKPETDPQKTGYTFKSWQLNGTDYVFSTPVTANIELKAKYDVDQYTISYDLAGGSVATANPASYTVETDSFTLNNPTKEGYTFAGWTGTDLTGAATTVTIAKGSTGNRSYTATWTLDT